VALCSTITTSSTQWQQQAQLLRLLQLCSPALPVGAYAFSQGLEAAIELQWLRSSQQIGEWLEWQLQQSLALVDLPILLCVHQAFADNDLARAIELNELLLACRETAELRLSDVAMGEALVRLLPKLDLVLPLKLETPTFLTLFTFAAQRWQLSAELTALGYSWSWLENQVLAATKLLPLGQTQAQQLLSELQLQVPIAISTAQALDRDAIGSSLSGLAFASLYHETQYTRLFRS
jgi:urease accessory protein